MYILRHFDWYGSIKELEKLEEDVKKLWDGSDGVKFLGRFAPSNRKYHFTWFNKATDEITWANRKRLEGFKRDYKILTHMVDDIYL